MGLMWFIGPDVTTPNRGKTLTLEVRKDSGYAEVFTEALVKRQAHDQAFDSKRAGNWFTQIDNWPWIFQVSEKKSSLYETKRKI